MIDLRQCKKGDRLRLRNGDIARYRRPSGYDQKWRRKHWIKFDGSFCKVHNNGRVNPDHTTTNDVVKIEKKLLDLSRFFKKSA